MQQKDRVNTLLLATLLGLLILGFRFVATTENLLLKFLFACGVVLIQSHLQILQHEAAHFNLFSSRYQNDFWGNFICSIPFFGLLSNYRKFHRDHHRYLLDPKKDPEVAFYKEQGYTFEAMPVKKLLWHTCKDLSGYHWLEFNKSFAREFYSMGRSSRAERAAGLAALLVLVTLIFKGFGLALLTYWVLPQATLLFFLLKIQGYGEHRMPRSSLKQATWLHQQNLFVRLLIFPLNSDCHLIHHQRVHLPWYHLRKASCKTGASAFNEETKVEGLLFGKSSLFKKLTIH